MIGNGSSSLVLKDITNTYAIKLFANDYFLEYHSEKHIALKVKGQSKIVQLIGFDDDKLALVRKYQLYFILLNKNKNRNITYFYY